MRISAIIVGLCIAHQANAHENEVRISMFGDQTCIESNGTPNHDIGQFPSRGNPNSFSAQNLKFCVDATPALTGRVETRVQVSGVSLTGIPFRPGTAEYYDPNGRHGFSRNRASGWRVEGMGGAMLGMDSQNGHVDNRGLYHYHAISKAYLAALDSPHVGYAADGFKILYMPGEARSSYVLKAGTRPNGPGGRYDGTYVEDWEFQQGAGNLDECNGAMINGEYSYFATDTYPFFPRCFKGAVSRDFLGRR